MVEMALLKPIIVEGDTMNLLEYKILADSTSENLKELAAEMLADFANDAKEQALKLYDNSGSSAIYFLEIFARCEKDDRVFDILIKELKEHKK